MINNYFKEISCPVCGKKNYKVLYTSNLKQEDFSHEVIVENFKNSISNFTKHGQIVKCNYCDIVYVNPIERVKYYISGYEEVVDTEYLRTEKFRKILSQKHLNKVEEFKKRGEILDVGCFAGFFLELARQRGWEIYGIEPSTWARSFAKKKGIKLVGKTIEDAKLPSNYFDTITMWDVIEHLSQPKIAIKKLYKTLKPDGVIAVGTPDVESFMFKMLREHHPYFIRMHLVLFSPKTLSNLLTKNGFRVLKVYKYGRTYPIYYILKRLETKFPFMKYIDWPLKLKLFSIFSVTLNVRDEFTIIAKKIA